MAAHLHILGICGTFMGGIAAIAKAAGYRVTGCDANVYPPMSDQLRALGIELTEGFGADQLALRPDVWVVGNVVTRGNPLMEAILDRGRALRLRAAMVRREVLAGKHVLAVAGTHGKTTVSAMLAWILERAGRSPGFLIGGVPNDFPVSARLTPLAVLRHRGRRVRHRLLRQALQVRPLPAAHGNTEQHRVRSCRHLRRSGRRSSGNFTTSCGLCRRSGKVVANGADESVKRVLAHGMLDAGGALRRRRPAGRRASPMRPAPSKSRWPGSAARPGALVAAGRAQPDERAGRARRRAPRRRRARAARSKRSRASAACAAACRCAARRGGSRSTTTSPTIRPRSAPRSRGCASASGAGAHPRGARAALEHDEARRDEGRAAAEPRRRPTACTSTPRVWAGTRRSLFALLGARARCEEDLEPLVAAVVAEARAGDHVLVMSNGGFGGIHDKLLRDRLSARV